MLYSWHKTADRTHTLPTQPTGPWNCGVSKLFFADCVFALVSLILHADDNRVYIPRRIVSRKSRWKSNLGEEGRRVGWA